MEQVLVAAYLAIQGAHGIQRIVTRVEVNESVILVKWMRDDLASKETYSNFADTFNVSIG